MNVLLFGATGMVGSGVLAVCLRDPDVNVVAITRSPVGVTHPNLREIHHQDFFSYAGLEREFSGADACFFCLGATSVGLNEAQYTRITYDLAVAAASAIQASNPAMTFCFVSGSHTDSTEKGSIMWARVKGRTENAILRLGFRAAYIFRPGYIQPEDGARSKAAWLRVLYAVVGPIAAVVARVTGRRIVTTATIGHAMLNVVRHGYPKAILEPPDIVAAGLLSITEH